MSKVLKGTIYTLAAGIAWGLSGTRGQYLLGHGFSALALTNLRLLLSGLALMGVAYLANRNHFRKLLKDKSSLFSILLCFSTNLPTWRPFEKPMQGQRRSCNTSAQ